MPKRESKEPIHRSARKHSCQTQADAAAYTARARALAAILEGRDFNECCELVKLAIDQAVIADREDPPFFTTEQLCRRWQVARRTVEGYAVPRTKLGGAVRFARQDVLDFERANVQKA